MNTLIIGYGSIGSRHAAILDNLGCSVNIVSSRTIGDYNRFENLKEAFSKQTFDYVIVSNRTCDHYKTLNELTKIGYNGLLLIEKPLFEKISPLLKYDFGNAFVAYNLRFHPIIQDIYANINNCEMFSIQIYVGSYLPDWRPDTDYSKCYSALKAEGGGVLRDLSHELDYLIWLTGGWRKVTAIGGTFGDLDIDSDDVFCLLIETEKCPAVILQLNYLDRISRREIIINLKKKSIKADLISNTLEINNKSKKYHIDRNSSYKNMHSALLNGNTENACSFKEGFEVLNLIMSTEAAAENNIWKSNNTR
jgi:predicted dehydrogenase